MVVKEKMQVREARDHLDTSRAKGRRLETPEGETVYAL